MNLAAIVLLVLASASCKAPSSPPNLAVLLVTTTIDADAKCTPYYTDAGETHVHSAECRLPNKSRVYCSFSTDKSPKCETIIEAPKPPAAAPTPSEAPPAAPPPTKAP